MQDFKESIYKTLMTEGNAIIDMGKNLDMEAAEKVVQLFCECKGMVFVTGCGTSGAAAKKIAHTLSCINRPTAYLNPADAVHGGMGIVSEGDVVVLLSKGGKTPEITSLVAACKIKGAATVAITENKESDLAKSCDICLKIFVEKEPDKFNMLATASTLTVIGVMDAIAIRVMEENGFTKEAFGVIHPGGAVGERLLNSKA
jgi:D-arabinose 5-phosphate isomerase GutQ